VTNSDIDEPDQGQRISVDQSEQLLASQTSEHRALTRKVYQRLSADTDIDDIKDLLAEFQRLADADRRQQGGIQWQARTAPTDHLWRDV